MAVDQVTVTSNGTVVSGWESVEIRRSIEQFPSAFCLTLTEVVPNSIKLNGGDDCVVKLGADTVITGWIHSVSFDTSASPQRRITVVGASKCCDIHDCANVLSTPPLVFTAASVPYTLSGLTIDGGTVLDIVTRICAAYQITVTDNEPDASSYTVPTFNINLTMTAYQVIEQVCRWAGLLCYDDTSGNIVLSRVNRTQRHSSGFVEGSLQQMRTKLDMSQRYSSIVVVQQSVDQLSDQAPNSNVMGISNDSGVTRPRVKIIQSDQNFNGQTQAQQTADWERNRRIGRSMETSVSVPGWRDSSGKLWTPNYLAAVTIPSQRVSNALWTIGSVCYRLDVAGGSMTELTLMAPDAFTVAPTFPPTVDADQRSQIESGGGGGAAPVQQPAVTAAPATTTPKGPTYSDYKSTLGGSVGVG